MRLRRVRYNLFKITKFINTGRISVRVTKALMWHWVYWFFLRQPAKPVWGTMLGWYRYKENWLSSSKVFTCGIWLFTHHMFPMCVDMALGRRNAWIGEDRSKNAKQEPEALKSGIWELSYESLGTHGGVGIGKIDLAVCFGDTPGRALIRFQPTLTEE